jgi:hypothetical protein
MINWLNGISWVPAFAGMTNTGTGHVKKCWTHYAIQGALYVR